MEPATTSPQRLPRALTGHGAYLAVRLGNQARRLFETAIAELGLRPGDYDFLSTVTEFGPISQREIAAILGIDAARIVATVDALQDRDIVARTVDPTDRRRNLIQVTEHGRTVVARATEIATQVEDELLTPLTDQERATLRELIRRALRFE
jgi:DNA-binding MarR family transcriptional regulator